MVEAKNQTKEKGDRLDRPALCIWITTILATEYHLSTFFLQSGEMGGFNRTCSSKNKS